VARAALAPARTCSSTRRRAPATGAGPCSRAAVHRSQRRCTCAA
jgi:hypothetical protein